MTGTCTIDRFHLCTVRDAGMTDPELLDAYRVSGSPEILGQIVERHTPMVYAACVRILRNRDAAEDAAQGTFLVLVKRGRNLPIGTLLPAWLHLTARNVARELLRASRRREKYERTATMTSPTNHDACGAPDEMLQEELSGRVDAALGALPEAQRNAVLLRYFYGLSEADAAQQMGISAQTLHMRVFRGIDKLRSSLAREGLTVSALALSGLLPACSPAAPQQLTANIVAACTGKAATSAAATAAAKSMSASASWAGALGSKTLVAILAAVLVPAAVWLGVPRTPSAPAPVVAPAAGLPPASNPVAGWFNATKADPKKGSDWSPIRWAADPLEPDNKVLSVASSTPWHSIGRLHTFPAHEIKVTFDVFIPKDSPAGAMVELTLVDAQSQYATTTPARIAPGAWVTCQYTLDDFPLPTRKKLAAPQESITRFYITETAPDPKAGPTAPHTMYVKNIRINGTPEPLPDS